MQQLPSETLKSRTFIGLLLAQFTATFNDQAIHMVAIFYASDKLVRYVGLSHVDEKAVVSLVTACFITPFLLFSPMAGLLSDKFSKRSIIVFWKVAEVGMMALALLGLSLPHFADRGLGTPQDLAVWSALLVVATVFLMGTHSTFFVPAKYGAMPEILDPKVLSRGNGLLEGTSFMAQIFGTSAGGILYALTKSPTVGKPGLEWLIGVLLLLLALIGTSTALLMAPIPVAAPDRKLIWNWWKPLRENMNILWRSKPLTLAVLGIAFAAFMTLFLRQTLLYEGEIAKELHTARRYQQQIEVQTDAARELPRRDGEAASAHGMVARLLRVMSVRLGSAAQQSELRVALLIALVGFGVGVGSLLAGFMSGHRVELGLVPVGAVLMALLAALLSLLIHSPASVVVCLFLVGAAAGLYIVPLYTLLQHRAPKESKGNVIAASNFLNVVGGTLAVAMFYTFTFALEGLFGPELKAAYVHEHPDLLPEFITQLVTQKRIPQILFLVLGAFTILLVVLMARRLPDIFIRAALWLRGGGRDWLRVSGAEHVPADGPVLLISDSGDFNSSLRVLAATDRYTRVILIEPGSGSTRGSHALRLLARLAGLLAMRSEVAEPSAWQQAAEVGVATLRQGNIVALALDGQSPSLEVASLVQTLCAAASIVLPVHAAPDAHGGSEGASASTGACSRVIIGTALPAQGSLNEALAALSQMATGR